MIDVTHGAAGGSTQRNNPGAWVLDLGDPVSTLARVGGKGASLARLVGGGLPVPPGFHITTAAYDRFVAEGGLGAQILAAAETAAEDKRGSCEQAADTIAQLIAAQPVPTPISDAISDGYRRLGKSDVAVAVRSSATAEDLPDLSFAGQQDSYLNVRGSAAVLEAVKHCWASLWTARAISYRLRNAVPSETLSVAVVVQQLVSADAAGVMFTADPVSGDTDRTVINAAWGLGEAVVGGQVTPDTVVVGRHTHVVTVGVHDKRTRTALAATGTRDEAVPAEQRNQAVLTPGEARALADLGTQIELLFGYPVDIEWARQANQLWILQARPISSSRRDRDPWNDSQHIDALWTRGNIGEAVPDVVTPCSRSLLDIVFDDLMPTLSFGGYRPIGYLGGRIYLNFSVLMTLMAAAGQGRRRLLAASGDLFGHVPDDVGIPVLPVSRWTVIKAVLPATVRNRRRIRRNGGELDTFLASAAAHCEGLREHIGRARTGAELVGIWQQDLLPFLHECNYMLEAGSKRDGASFIKIRARLRRLVGEADSNALLLAADGASQLASLGPLQGLDELRRGVIDQTTFARLYGHHSAHLFEVSIPRPGEDPGGIDAQLDGLRDAQVDLAALLEGQRAVQEAAWERFCRRHPARAKRMSRTLARARASTQLREAARSEQARVFWALRSFVVRAGELTGAGDDLFFLSIQEILALLGGDHSVRDQVGSRRAAYSGYCALPSYPALVRGRFDPFTWAADPNRRTDIVVAGRAPAPIPASDLVRGFPGSPGQVAGRARVVLSVEDGDRLQAGDILVTTLTNVGWTPLFPRAGGIVTDIGAPLSHAAIVARELGIPAVLGCGDATTRIQDGDWISLDGTVGTVAVCQPQQDPT